MALLVLLLLEKSPTLLTLRPCSKQGVSFSYSSGILPSIFLVVRLYTKYCIPRYVNISDLAMFIAWAPYVDYMSTGWLGNNVSRGLDQWDLRLRDFISMLYYFHVESIIYGICIFFIKLPILLQFLKDGYTPEVTQPSKEAQARLILDTSRKGSWTCGLRGSLTSQFQNSDLDPGEYLRALNGLILRYARRAIALLAIEQRTGSKACPQASHLKKYLAWLRQIVRASSYSVTIGIPSEASTPMRRRISTFLTDILRRAAQKPRLHHHVRILEIGAGTGSITGYVLEALTRHSRRGSHYTDSHNFLCYDFTDISGTFPEQAKECFSTLGTKVTYKTLDLEAEAQGQGFETGSYDLVVAA
ncbi:hypothetical protein BDV11DRAFT_173582 [Aspergillus similis]